MPLCSCAIGLAPSVICFSAIMLLLCRPCGGQDIHVPHRDGTAAPGWALQHHLALLQDVGAIGHAQGEICHLLHQQDRPPHLAEVLDDIEDLPHQKRREAQRRLIEQHDARGGHQPARYR